MAASAEPASNYPSLSAKQWWALRDRFKRSVPSVVSAGYLETAFNLNASTARDTVNQLRYLGLIDAENRPTEILEDWRHDESYAKACAAIRDTVYPEELRQAAPDPAQDRSPAERWFARKKKVGANAALKMGITYQLVSEADPAKGADAGKGGARAKNTDRPRTRSAEKPSPARNSSSSNGQHAGPVDVPPTPPRPQGQPQSGPSLHIDVQIHIAADATAAQIDQIFASMAKHLYQGRSSSDA